MIVALEEKVNRSVLAKESAQEIQPQKTEYKNIYFGLPISPAGDSAIMIESGRIRDIQANSTFRGAERKRFCRFAPQRVCEMLPGSIPQRKDDNMVTTGKRAFMLLLTLLFCAASLGSLLPVARAEEVTDAYVLSFDNAVADYAYGSMPYMYKSPFMMRHSFYDPGSGPSSVWTYTYTNEIFQLINTAKLAEGGEGAYASISAYCTDADTGTRSNTTYRRINLEDSTYHESGAAARLRSVILSSFPYIQDMQAIADAANVWLQANGMSKIEQLQIGEAMLATQQAIWEITHGDKYTVEDPYTGVGDYDGSDAVYQTNASETETEFTENNIQMLCAYLLALPGTAPMDDAVSEASFENVRYSAQKEENGTYSVTVSFRVAARIDDGDSLTLSAYCGGQSQKFQLTQAGEYQFTFRDMEDRQEVKLVISGHQTGADVYLFDADGDRTVSQSMVGYDNSRLPVYGEVIVTPDRILNIMKTTGEAEGKIPLADISFQVYKVATLSQLEKGEVVLSEKPSEEDIRSYAVPENLIATLTTDAAGNASFNFTQNSQPDGVYMIVELPSAATIGVIEPFFISVPGTTEDGAGNVYTISVNPKNTAETGPDIKKDVTEIENDSDSFDAFQPHTWILRGGIPAGLANAKKYVITDTLDSRLTYTKGSPVVKLYTRAGEELELTEDVHYTLSEGVLTDGEHSRDHFAVALTREGMGHVMASLGDGTCIPELRVYYEACIDADADLGTQIPNQAELNYVNSSGVEYDVESDIPEVHTGGVHLLKTDVDGNPLAGAQFRIAREATEEELLNPEINLEKLTVNGQVLDVVFVSFHPDEDLSLEKVDAITTDAEGKASFCGLAYGTYYIVETKAPAGYNLLSQPIEARINELSHRADEELNSTILVVNTRFVLPETGGMGTTLFTVVGLGILSCAAIILILNHKKSRI